MSETPRECSTRGCHRPAIPRFVVCHDHVTVDVVPILNGMLDNAEAALAAARKAEAGLHIACDKYNDLARGYCLRADKAEAENARLREEIERLHLGNVDRARMPIETRRLIDIANEQRATAATLREALEEIFDKIKRRTGLCYGEIMGYGCSGDFHNPLCRAALQAAAPQGREEKK
jgi:hypothetical protein